MYYVQFESLITLDSLEIWQIVHSLILHITISNHDNFCSFTQIHFALFQRNSSIPTTASLLERGFMQVFHLFLSRNSLTGKILICPGFLCCRKFGFIYFYDVEFCYKSLHMQWLTKVDQYLHGLTYKNSISN